MVYGWLVWIGWSGLSILLFGFLDPGEQESIVLLIVGYTSCQSFFFILLFVQILTVLALLAIGHWCCLGGLRCL
jgi:hypothetical protein